MLLCDSDCNIYVPCNIYDLPTCKFLCHSRMSCPPVLIYNPFRHNFSHGHLWFLILRSLRLRFLPCDIRPLAFLGLYRSPFCVLYRLASFRLSPGKGDYPIFSWHSCRTSYVSTVLVSDCSVLCHRTYDKTLYVRMFIGVEFIYVHDAGVPHAILLRVLSRRPELITDILSTQFVLRSPLDTRYVCSLFHSLKYIIFYFVCTTSHFLHSLTESYF